MSSDDLTFLTGLMGGNVNAAKAALKAGANANGSQGLPCVPLVMATISDEVGVVNFFLERGADPDMPVTEELPHPCPSSEIAAAMAGERALHIAARRGSVDIVRLLLRSRADPNATDKRGYTPLTATCESPLVCAEVMQLLLAAGADPALAEERGFLPLHGLALNGHVDLVDMLHSRAPAMLNRCVAETGTPLFLACAYRHERMVSKLLSLGARQPMEDIVMCPLVKAVDEGFVGVVRVLVNEGGVAAVGGDEALPRALHVAVCVGRAGILRLLLSVGGEERRSEWANSLNTHGPFCDRTLLHNGAAFCFPAVVSILLEAGADEAARDSKGRIPRDTIGMGIEEVRMDRRKGVAIDRMLQRGPAYRARSWAWPSDEEAKDAGRSGHGGTTAAATDDVAVLWSPPAVKTPPALGVRIFRPKGEESRRKAFVRLIGRYCAKD